MHVEHIGPMASFVSSITWAIGVNVYAQMSRNYSAYSVNFARALIALPLFLALAWLNGSLGMLYPFPWKSSLWLGTSILSSFALGDIFFLLSTRSFFIFV